MGTGREHSLENDLLAFWDQPTDSGSALAICRERDHLAAQWTACIAEALAKVRH
jgi:hypothetical protein